MHSDLTEEEGDFVPSLEGEMARKREGAIKGEGGVLSQMACSREGAVTEEVKEERFCPALENKHYGSSKHNAI